MSGSDIHQLTSNLKQSLSLGQADLVIENLNKLKLPLMNIGLVPSFTCNLSQLQEIRKFHTGDAYEQAVNASIKLNDVSGMEKYIKLLKAFYFDFG